MLRALLAALVLVLLLPLVSGAAPVVAQETDEGIVISGGDLAHPVRLAYTDEDAFVRRLTLPPLLDEEPATQGNAYTVSSDYWDAAVRDGRDDRPAIDRAATYYQDLGYVRTRQAGEDVWIVLDLRQRAILDRYIALTRINLLPQRPGILQVLSAAYRSEDIAVHVGGRQLHDVEARALWSGLAFTPAPAFVEPAVPPIGARGTWTTFSLEDGRIVQVFYDPGTRLFSDAFGAEVYRVPEPVAEIFSTLGLGRTTGIPVAQEEAPGGWYWWVIMVGGGLTSLGAAFWLRHRLAAASL